MYSQYQRGRMFSIALTVMIICMVVVAVVPRPTEGATFIIAEWDYPDEYGQGIEGFEFYENTTGSWVQVGGYRWHNATSTYTWNYTYIKLRCWTYFNSTLTGAGSTAEGQLLQRHNITVSFEGETVFEQNNFTYATVSTAAAPMWWYCYEVVINAQMFVGVYVVVVDYEIFY